MTLMSSISKLTTSVDQLADEANVTKSQLDAKVALAVAEIISSQGEQAATEAAQNEAAAHAVDAAIHLATVKADVTFQGISAVLAEKAVTAVDVFVYDTSLDSDGGAWRKRCQHTSWYNEPLNTATRGAGREFPAVAVIVAESAKVTIYDGDDRSLPMWMAFTYEPGCALGNADFRNRAISAINGVLAVGTAHPTYSDYGGVMLGAFPEDAILYHGRFPSASDKPHGNFRGGLALRQSAGYDKSSLVSTLTSGQPRDIAMTVLPDAPVDPVTGLPVPTIAVATDGGVSVIKDDGGVQNISGPAVRNISVNRNHELIVNFTALDTLVVEPLNTTDAIISWNTGTRGYSHNPATGMYPFISFRHSSVTPFSDGFAFHGIGGSGKLQRVAEDFANARRSMLCDTVSDYTTGWMPGAIKGAFLSDTDDTDLVGSTPLDDDFSTYADTAAMIAAGWSGDGTSVITLNANGYIDVARNGSSTEAGATTARWVVTGLTVGRRYRLSVDVVARSDAVSLRVYNSVFNSVIVDKFSTAAAPFSLGLEFTATSTSHGIGLGVRNNAFGTASFDNISVQLADADRSVNANGLIVNGTITRSPVADGAELVAYSGFHNPNNYLEQSYNPDLDFGTGDFCVMFWAKDPDLFDAFMCYGKVGSTNGWLWQTGATDKSYRFFTNATNRISPDVFPGKGTGWHMHLMKRIGSSWSFFVDGKQAWEIADNADVTVGEGASLVIGNLAANKGRIVGDDVFTGSLALLRISATAPSADQIAKIYEDEHKLFMPGAKCTLYGTSDAVTALAHDPKTNLLHVGTSQGRSVFDGLQRVAHTEIPVTTAISAAGGLIVEE